MHLVLICQSPHSIIGVNLHLRLELKVPCANHQPKVLVLPANHVMMLMYCCSDLLQVHHRRDLTPLDGPSNNTYLTPTELIDAPKRRDEI